MKKHPEHTRCDPREEETGVVREQDQCVLGNWGGRAGGGHARESEAVELREGVEAPLVSQSMKQVIINYQKSFASTCLDNLLHGIFSFLYWSESFYKFQSPKDPPPDHWSPTYQALHSDYLEDAQIPASEGKAGGIKSFLPELSHMEAPQIIPSWMWVAPSPLCYPNRAKEQEPGANMWPLEYLHLAENHSWGSFGEDPFMAWVAQHSWKGMVNCQKEVTNKSHFLTAKAVMTFNLLYGNLFKTCCEPTRYTCVCSSRFICLRRCISHSSLLGLCLEYTNEMFWWTRRCPAQTRRGRGSHGALTREGRSRLGFGWGSLAGWSCMYRQQKTGVLHRRSRINLILSSIIIILYPQHVRLRVCASVVYLGLCTPASLKLCKWLHVYT